MDESYRTFAFIAAFLTVLHFVLPVVVSLPACSDSIAVMAPSALLVCLGSVYACGYLIWIKTVDFSDLFDHDAGNNGQAKHRRQYFRRAEDVRYMTLLWMVLGATGLLSNDLVWTARYILTFSSPGSNALLTWMIWTASSALLSIIATFSIGHLLSLGAEAEIEAAKTTLQRINRLKTKAIKLH